MKKVQEMHIFEALKLLLYLPFGLYYQTKSIFVQLFISFAVGSAMMPICRFVDTYVYNDWHFFRFFLVIISLDIVTGIWKHWKKRSLDHEVGFKKFVTKFFVCIISLVLFHVFSNFAEHDKQDIWIHTYATYLKGAMIFSYIGISVAVNLYEISDGKFPPIWIISRFKNYNDKGEKIG